MHYDNALEPTAEQIAGFSENDNDASGPIYMVNLLKYREKAAYPDGRSQALTGREAYALYSEGVVKTLAAVDGAIVFAGQVKRLVLGEVEDLWDDVAIAMYPSRAAMLEMMLSPEYQEIAVHRAAGLEGQLNIETNALLAPAAD